MCEVSVAHAGPPPAIPQGMSKLSVLEIAVSLTELIELLNDESSIPWSLLVHDCFKLERGAGDVRDRRMR